MKKCGMLQGTKIVVKYDGSVLPCEAFKEHKLTERVTLGNINTDSMDVCMKRFNTNPVINLLRFCYGYDVLDPNFDLYKTVEENQDVFTSLIGVYLNARE